MERIIDLAVAGARGETLESQDLPLNLRMIKEALTAELLAGHVDLTRATERFETELVRTVLRRLDGDRERAARFLGISLEHLDRRSEEAAPERSAVG
jgi:DNA-binding NtrC family response regulator